MKKFLFLFAALALSVGTFAQNMQETVYLKNGSIIRGIIIEQVPAQSLKIRTKDGNIFVFAMSDVEKISKENVSDRHFRSNRRMTHSRWSGPISRIRRLELDRGRRHHFGRRLHRPADFARLPDQSLHLHGNRHRVQLLLQRHSRQHTDIREHPQRHIAKQHHAVRRP